MRIILFSSLVLLFVSCSKSKPNSNATPVVGDVSLTAVVSTDSSGNVSFTASAANAVSYVFSFGDGNSQSAQSGKVTYTYFASGSYTASVIATGAGGDSKSMNLPVTIGKKLSLIWSDEFDSPGSPDPTKWTFDLGGGGWGNNELEYYTSRQSNAYVSNGTLKIVANKESYMGSAYTSARMLTQGLYSFKYGKIEISAKLPASIGTWPAIWMLGSDISTVSWPACGEVDIMEQSGSLKNTIYGTLHYPTEANQYGDGGTTPITNASTAFHKYATIWTPISIQILVDDVVFYTLPNNNTLPFNQDFFIILNIAMGGNFGGTVDPSFATDQMEIDYVRVYQ